MTATLTDPTTTDTGTPEIGHAYCPCQAALDDKQNALCGHQHDGPFRRRYAKPEERCIVCTHMFLTDTPCPVCGTPSLEWKDL